MRVVQLAAFCLILHWTGPLASQTARADADLEIAARYAPVLYQETGSNPKADQITSIDFDGNWASNDNWENLPRFPTPGQVYYSVIESETHWFITYAFFHPRDYTRVCFVWFCHENDMEGAGGAVDKATGEAVYLETKAHLSMDRVGAPTTVERDGERRIALYIEKEGHGVHGWTAG